MKQYEFYKRYANVPDEYRDKKAFSWNEVFKLLESDKWGKMRYTKTILLIAITTLILTIATAYRITHWWGNMIQQGTSQRGKIECYRNQFGDMCFTAPCCKKSSKSCKYEGYHGDVMSSKELLKCYTFWEIIKIKVLKWWGKANETKRRST